MKLSSGSMAGLAMSLLSGSKLVAAQTWTSCNPMEKSRFHDHEPQVDVLVPLTQFRILSPIPFWIPFDSCGFI